MKTASDVSSYGLKPEIISRLHKVFECYEDIESVVLYGSRAKGTYHAGSDIDITLKGDHLTDLEVAKVEDDIDDLLLPYLFDISSWDQIDNEDLRAHIERVGVVLYEKCS